MYQLPVDKANHFVYGIGLFMALAFARDPVFAVVLVATVAAVKEIYDGLTKTGTPDIWDAMATIFGGVAGYVCTLL